MTLSLLRSNKLLLVVVCLISFMWLYSCDNTDDIEAKQIPIITYEKLIIDPTKLHPLTANLYVNTDIETTVSIRVHGQDGEDLTHSFEIYSKEHIVPILGLYPDYNNVVDVVLTANNGEEVIITKEIMTDPVSIEISEFEPTIYNDVSISDGYYMLQLSRTNGIGATSGLGHIIIDKFGKIRWINLAGIGHVFKPMSNGRYLSNAGNNCFYEVDLLGVKYNYWSVGKHTHHDATMTDSNTLLFLSNADGSVDDGVVELNLENNTIVKDLDMQNILDRDRPIIPYDNGLASDWLHLNGIDYSSMDDSYIISGRNQSAVIKMDRQTDEIKWILSDHTDWDDSFKKYLLTPIGSNFEYQYAQHASIFNPNDNSKILLFDNGAGRSIENTLAARENYTRAVEYRIDEDNMTVEQTWEFGKEYGSKLYSQYISNATYLENGNILICFGGIIRDTNGNPIHFADYPNNEVNQSVRIVEVDYNTKEVVWELALDSELGSTMGCRCYRAYKVEI